MHQPHSAEEALKLQVQKRHEALVKTCENLAAELKKPSPETPAKMAALNQALRGSTIFTLAVNARINAPNINPTPFMQRVIKYITSKLYQKSVTNEKEIQVALASYYRALRSAGIPLQIKGSKRIIYPKTKVAIADSRLDFSIKQLVDNPQPIASFVMAATTHLMGVYPYPSNAQTQQAMRKKFKEIHLNIHMIIKQLSGMEPQISRQKLLSKIESQGHLLLMHSLAIGNRSIFHFTDTEEQLFYALAASFSSEITTLKSMSTIDISAAAQLYTNLNNYLFISGTLIECDPGPTKDPIERMRVVHDDLTKKLALYANDSQYASNKSTIDELLASTFGQLIKPYYITQAGGPEQLTDLHLAVIDYHKKELATQLKASKELTGSINLFYDNLSLMGLEASPPSSEERVLLLDEEQLKSYPGFLTVLHNEGDTANYYQYTMTTILSLLKMPAVTTTKEGLHRQFNILFAITMGDLNQSPNPYQKSDLHRLISSARSLLALLHAYQLGSPHKLQLKHYQNIMKRVETLSQELRLPANDNPLDAFYKAIRGDQKKPKPQTAAKPKKKKKKKALQPKPPEPPVTKKPAYEWLIKALEEHPHYTVQKKADNHCFITSGERSYRLELVSDNLNHQLLLSRDGASLNIEHNGDTGNRNPIFANRIVSSLQSTLPTLDAIIASRNELMATTNKPEERIPLLKHHLALCQSTKGAQAEIKLVPSLLEELTTALSLGLQQQADELQQLITDEWKPSKDSALAIQALRLRLRETKAHLTTPTIKELEDSIKNSEAAFIAGCKHFLETTKDGNKDPVLVIQRIKQKGNHLRLLAETIKTNPSLIQTMNTIISEAETRCDCIVDELQLSIIPPSSTSRLITADTLDRKFISQHQNCQSANYNRLHFFISTTTQLVARTYQKGSGGLDTAGIHDSAWKHEDIDLAVFLTEPQLNSLCATLLTPAQLSYGVFEWSPRYSDLARNYHSYTIHNVTFGTKLDITLLVGIMPKAYMALPCHQTSFCTLTRVFIEHSPTGSVIAQGNTLRNLPKNQGKENNTPVVSMIYLRSQSLTWKKLVSAINHLAKCAIKSGTFEQIKPLLLLFLEQVPDHDWNKALHFQREKLHPWYRDQVCLFAQNSRPASGKRPRASP